MKRNVIERTPLCKDADVVAETVLVAGRDVVDVGCGNGSLVRWLARQGARAIGVDLLAPVGRARRVPTMAGERFVVGKAEALPLPSASADIVLFVTSLHHVPVMHMDRALAEARRILQPRGVIYVQEPLAEGPHHRLVRTFDDECELYAAARAATCRAMRLGMFLERDLEFARRIVYSSFDGFLERMRSTAPERATALLDRRVELRNRFENLATPRSDGYEFLQPMRVIILRAP